MKARNRDLLAAVRLRCSYRSDRRREYTVADVRRAFAAEGLPLILLAYP
jgi:hypothetical protein